MFAYQATDTFAFVADDESERTGQIRLVVHSFRFTSEADNPDILTFKEFNGACEVGLLRLPRF